MFRSAILLVGLLMAIGFLGLACSASSPASTNLVSGASITPNPIPAPPALSPDVLVVTGRAGDTVAIPIRLVTGTERVRSIQANLTYDGLALLNPEVRRGDDLPATWLADSNSPVPGETRFIALSVNLGEEAQPINGIVFVVTFTVNTKIQRDVPVTVSLVDVRSGPNEEIPVEVSNGVIRVVR